MKKPPLFFGGFNIGFRFRFFRAAADRGGVFGGGHGFAAFQAGYAIGAVLPFVLAGHVLPPFRA